MIKEVLEHLYFLSGPIIAFLAFKGLHQIAVSKEIAKTNAKREAFKLTAEQCRYYAEKIIPLANKLDEAIDTHDVQILKKSKHIIENNEIKVEPFVNYKHYKESNSKIAKEFTDLYNSLNSFSLFFVSGVADERLAYMTLSNTYCHTVKKVLPILVPVASSDGEDNVLKLFMIWYHRKNKENAIREKNALDEKIKKSSDITIRAIGT